MSGHHHHTHSDRHEHSSNHGFLKAAFSRVSGKAGEWLQRNRRTIVLGAAATCAAAEMATTNNSMISSLMLLFAGAAIAHDASEDAMEAIGELKSSQKLSPGVVGTAVGFGHTLGEAALSAVSSAQGASDLAVSSVMGSQPSHILLMAGGAAVIGTIGVGKSTSWKLHAAAMTGLTGIFGAQIAGGEMSPILGSLMMGGGVYYLYRRFTEGEACATHGSSCAGHDHHEHHHEHHHDHEEHHSHDHSHSHHHDHEVENNGITLRERLTDPHLLRLAGSVTALSASAHVMAGQILTQAENIGISETAAGATVAALSMAAPEIILTWKAAHKGETDMAWGTVAGCATATVGIVGGGLALGGVSVPETLNPMTAEGATHMAAFAGSTAAILAATHPKINQSGDLSKKLGAAFLASYLGYVALVSTFGDAPKVAAQQLLTP